MTNNQNPIIGTQEACGSGECCGDCSKCRFFPAPYRRIGESPYCRFTRHMVEADDRTTFSGDRMVRILFVISGALHIVDGNMEERAVASHQYVCLARGGIYNITATEQSHVVVLTLLHRIEFCEEDIYDQEIPHDSVVAMDSMPVLGIHTAIGRLLEDMFAIPEMIHCGRYHRIKTSELFMMLKVLYTPVEHAYFFQSMIQPRDNFCVFVCNNYDKAESVAELAELAGMSLSVFKRRFAEYFNDSVYHWMMRQKALKVFADIRDGEDNTKALMSKYGFKYYTQFSRFCKTYLQSTPAQLISSIKEG